MNIRINSSPERKVTVPEITHTHSEYLKTFLIGGDADTGKWIWLGSIIMKVNNTTLKKTFEKEGFDKHQELIEEMNTYVLDLTGGEEVNCP